MKAKRMALAAGLGALVVAGSALAVTAYAGEKAAVGAPGDLAFGRPAQSANGSCRTSESPAKLVDGSAGGTANKWCSADGATKRVQVDLGASRALGRLVVKHAGAGGEPAGFNTRAFTLEVSTDGTTWSTVGTASANTASVTEHKVATTARWVRLSTTDPIARIYEIEAYAPSAPAAGPGFTEEFTGFDKKIWSCEYSCPTVSGGSARFTLKAGTPPNSMGSWSKTRYKPATFTSGRFTVQFSLTQRPKQKVWWGTALWDDGPAADGSQFNEINFGYTTNQSFTDSQLLFESAKRGKFASLKVDTGVNLYDGKTHTATLEYDATHVSFTFDGKLLKTITDPSVIPTDPMSLILGPRLVTGSAPLTSDFTQTVAVAEIGK